MTERINPPLSTARERLYALGIDSFRLIEIMLAGNLNTDLPLDGVSGQIRLNGHNFERTALPAVFAQGRAQLTGASASATPVPLMFPGQSTNPP
jgi:outer membrane PBP1 activator LpoA protein